MRISLVLSGVPFAALAAVALSGCAGSPGNLRANQAVPEQYDASKLTLAPLQFVSFCMRNGADCAPRGAADAVIALSPQMFAAIEEVNRSVNDQISPSREEAIWRINPPRGNCNDYVVSKRHQLLALGLPSSALLISVVRTVAGEGHLVLVLRTDRGDLVLDNLVDSIRDAGQVPYSWIKRQTTRDPQLWEKV